METLCKRGLACKVSKALSVPQTTESCLCVLTLGTREAQGELLSTEYRAHSTSRAGSPIPHINLCHWMLWDSLDSSGTLLLPWEVKQGQIQVFACPAGPWGSSPRAAG